MRIDFNKIILKNFMSFEKAEVILDNLGYILVNGVNENPDDLARSNGSGKSTLFEAIAWSITGETIRGSKDVRRLGSEGECSVTLDFKVDGDLYKIIRTKDPSNLKVYINNEDKSGKGIRDTEKLLAEYLPDLTSQLVGSVIILGQGLPQRFTNNTPSGRKEVLEQLSKSDFMIEDLKRRIGTRKNQLANEVRDVEDSILVNTTKKESIKRQLDQTIAALQSLPTKEVYQEQIRLAEQAVAVADEKLNAITEERKALDVELDSIQNALNVKIQESQTRLITINNKYAQLIQDVDKTIAGHEANIRNLNAEITKLKSVKEFCPTCGQRLPDVHKVDTSEQEAELIKNQQWLADTKEIAKKVRADLDAEIKASNDQYKEETAGLETAKTTIKLRANKLDGDFTVALQQKQQDADVLTRSRTGLENLIQTKESYGHAIDNFNTELVDLDNKIAYNNNEKNRLEAHCAVIARMATLITRDFRGYLLTNVIDFINRKAKEYAQDVFETDKIEFTIDGNNISISYDGKEYECLSGGEKQKIDVIVQLSIRDMLCTFLGFSCNCLIVDELFDGLDDIGCQRVINLISTKLTDVQTIYIVTHHTDIQIPCDGEIVVVKGADKISRIGG